MNSNWTVNFYKDSQDNEPVKNYLNSLPDKQRAKVLRDLQLLEEFGPALGMPSVRNLGDKLLELRVKQGTNISRVFFITWTGREIVLLNGFTKKSQKTPPGEIQKALRLRDEYISRHQQDRKGY